MSPIRIQSSQRARFFGQLALQSFTIILSVVLGLLANEWRLAQQKNKEAQTALRAVKQELSDNLQQIEQQLNNHRKIQDRFSKLMVRVMQPEAQAVTIVEMQQAMPGGFDMPLIRQNAWELLNRTGAISSIDFDLANSLSLLYHVQQFYQGKLDLFGLNGYLAGNVDLDRPENSAVAIGILVQDILVQEERLVQMYPEMIERIEMQVD